MAETAYFFALWHFDALFFNSHKAFDVAWSHRAGGVDSMWLVRVITKTREGDTFEYYSWINAAVRDEAISGVREEAREPDIFIEAICRIGILSSTASNDLWVA